MTEENLRTTNVKEKSENRGKMIQRMANEGRNKELENLRNALGEIGGAGHFCGNDKMKSFGGVRDHMGQAELKNVIRLLAAGEKRINLKEREFRAFLNEKKTERNSKKVLLF